jgi:hypothetical protein
MSGAGLKGPGKLVPIETRSFIAKSFVVGGRNGAEAGTDVQKTLSSPNRSDAQLVARSR